MPQGILKKSWLLKKITESEKILFLKILRRRNNAKQLLINYFLSSFFYFFIPGIPGFFKENSNSNFFINVQVAGFQDKLPP